MLKALIKRLEILEYQKKVRAERTRTFFTEVVDLLTGIIIKRFPCKGSPDTFKIPNDEYWNQYGTSQAQVAEDLARMDDEINRVTEMRMRVGGED